MAVTPNTLGTNKHTTVVETEVNHFLYYHPNESWVLLYPVDGGGGNWRS